jgi:hypothetical protein
MPLNISKDALVTANVSFGQCKGQLSGAMLLILPKPACACNAAVQESAFFTSVFPALFVS